MKIYTELMDEELATLSGSAGGERRWTENRSDLGVNAVVAVATVAEEHVDFIRSRQAREDGGWSKEVCLFRGATVADLSVI